MKFSKVYSDNFLSKNVNIKNSNPLNTKITNQLQLPFRTPFNITTKPKTLVLSEISIWIETPYIPTPPDKHAKRNEPKIPRKNTYKLRRHKLKTRTYPRKRKTSDCFPYRTNKMDVSMIDCSSRSRKTHIFLIKKLLLFSQKVILDCDEKEHVTSWLSIPI